MLKFYCMMFLILPFRFLSQSNKLTVTGTKQSWAGGICCSSGTNYVLHLSSGSVDLQQVVVERISVDGNCIASGWQLSSGVKSLILSFGTRNDHKQYKTFYPREGEQVHKDHRCPENNTIRLCINGETEEFTISELKELPYLAYP
ncbi:MAG: hypothetical protein ACO1O6_00145 [Bacteroidota bacterium]